MDRPAYRRISNVLRRGILSGEYPPGHKFPCESELAKQFGVSQITIRHAMRLLEEHWLVDRRPGRGTLVCPVWRKKKVPILMSDYAGSIRSHLPDIERKLLCVDRRIPVAWAGELLELREGKKCLYSERVDSHQGEPLVYDAVYIPLEFCSSIDDDMLGRIGFLAEWMEQEDLELGRVDVSMEAQQARDEHVERLGVRLAFPMLVVRETFIDPDGRRLCLVESHYRSDRFTMLWSDERPQRKPKARSRTGKRRSKPSGKTA